MSVLQILLILKIDVEVARQAQKKKHSPCQSQRVWHDCVWERPVGKTRIFPNFCRLRSRLRAAYVEILNLYPYT